MKQVYDDGGRGEAGYRGHANDCVCRSITIVTGRPYQDVYDRLAEGMGTQRKSKHSGSRTRSAREGITTTRKWFKDYMVGLGFTWVPIMKIGSGCTVHLRDGELPMGRLVVSVSKHMCAVIDGVIYDTHDPSRDGTRCVYGYWRYDNAT